MFQTARLKLTLWYVLIIMAVSVIFSVAIYFESTQEIQRIADGQRARIERRVEDEYLIPPQFLPPEPSSDIQDLDLENESIRRIQFLLLDVNCLILLVSGAAAYFLAGRTLKPIIQMVDEQQRFISDASHELKTPLTALRTTFEVALRSHDLSLKEAKELIKDNLSEVEQLQTLSEALLRLSNYQQPLPAKALELLNLKDTTAAAIKKVSPLAKQEKITIESDLQDVSMMGIQSQLTELAVILLDNAIKYSPANSTIHLKVWRDNNFAKLSITDHGLGISHKELPHIFDRFYRADESRTKNKVSGYGLGLAIAYQIIKTHSGSVNVQSVVGKGSTFTVQFGAQVPDSRLK